MPLKLSIGKQDFVQVREEGCFYVDKTHFIKEWWEYGDDVTLITRPRRFGKTLMLSMLEAFFSLKYAYRGELFEGLSIWQEEEYQKQQGNWPVIALSFANVKAVDYIDAKIQIFEQFYELYHRFEGIVKDEFLECTRKGIDQSIDRKERIDISEGKLALTLHTLSEQVMDHYGKKVLIFLDEYDTPMQEAYVSGYWEELAGLFRNLFNSTFKTNPALYRAVLTGITRVSRESIFSDLNNLEIVTTTSDKYADSFGFTEQEVFDALDAQGLSDKKTEVRCWYDGFTFGKVTDIYNPWSIINYLQKQRFDAYWANTSSNSLVGKLIRESNPDVKMTMERLLDGGMLETEIDEQIVFDELPRRRDAIWSLLLASGYLKVAEHNCDASGRNDYTLMLTNFEVRRMFDSMISGWFNTEEGALNEFVRALLAGDLDTMNGYMNDIAMSSFSYFDSGTSMSESKGAERFYHGFVLGLLVDLRRSHRITSNRESGFGRYDVMLEPLDAADDAIIIEFKVFNPKKERTLEDTLAAALAQIEEKAYDAQLLARGIATERIRHYGFAFQGKTVLIG